MVLPCSKRLLRFVSSSYKLQFSNQQDIVRRSFHVLSTASCDHDIGDKQSFIEYSDFRKSRPPFMYSRGFCTSMLSSESSEGSFPSDLLSRKQVLTPERVIGQLQDLVIPVTNFHNEDKELMVLVGDIFDLPIRKDIIRRVVRWQLAKRQQGLNVYDILLHDTLVMSRDAVNRIVERMHTTINR